MFNNLYKLKGKRLRGIGRTSDMLWISFGEEMKVKGYNNMEITKGEYALHIQTPWRIIENNKIVIGNYDIYVSKNGDWIEDFKWDEKGENLFDKKYPVLKEKIVGNVVKKITICEFGDIKIFLENDCEIEIFINSSIQQEYWRFIDNIENEHIVCFDDI